MKRPLACIGLGVLSALAAAAAFPDKAIFMAALCLVLSAALFALRIISHSPDILRSRTLSTLERLSGGAPLFFLAAAVAALYYVFAALSVRQPVINEFADKTVVLSGVVTSEPYTEGKTTSFTVRTSMINGESCRENIYVYTSEVPSGGEGDFICARAHLYRPDCAPGSYYDRYLNARRIFLTAAVYPYYGTHFYVAKNERPSFAAAMCKLRRAMRSAFSACLPDDEAMLCTAVITGDRNGISDEVRRRFNTLGISHIITVSGLHLSIVAAALSILLTRRVTSRFISCSLILAGAFAFAVLAGFGWSVRRALLMLAVMTVSQFIHEKPDLIGSLGAAALIICLDPFAPSDIGLLWSFSCTFAIIALEPRISEKLEKVFKNEPFVFAVSTTLAAFVGSIPFFILAAGSVSPYTIAANLLCAPMTAVVIAFGMAAALLHLAGLIAAANALMLIAGLAAKYMLAVSKIMAGLPFAGLSLDRRLFVVWLVLCAVLFGVLTAFTAGARAYRFSAAVCAAALFAAVTVDIFFNGENVTLTVTDTGSGISAFARYAESTVVLFAQGDSSSYYLLKNELDSGASCVIDTAPKECQNNYVRKLLRDLTPERAVISDSARREKYYSWYEYCGGEVRLVSDGRIHLGEGCEIESSSTGGTFCEYLTIYGNEILLCPDDGGELPERFRGADAAVLSSGAHFDELCADTMIIMSNDSKQYFDSRIICAPSGTGSVEMTFRPDGSIHIRNK